MKVSVELFLLDNTLMNLVVYSISAVLLNARGRLWRVLSASLLGAVVALVTMNLTYPPILRLLMLPIICLPLFEKGRSVIVIIAAVGVASVITGGVALLLTIATGGTVAAGGALIGTVRLRTALICLLVLSRLPCLLRRLMRGRKAKGMRLTCVCDGMLIDTVALCDSGNLVREPFSGLPVILVDSPQLSGSIPIAFSSQGGEGLLFAQKPRLAVLTDAAGHEFNVDAYVARAPRRIKGYGAIVPASLIPNEWRNEDEVYSKEVKGFYKWFQAVACKAFCRRRQLRLHQHRRDTAAAAEPCRGGGACEQNAPGGSPRQADSA